MATDTKRLGELRQHYRNTLLTIADRIGSADRSTLNAEALLRVRHALGVKGGQPVAEVPARDVQNVLVEYVISLRQVLKEFAGLDLSAENQQAIGELETGLSQLLQTSP